MRQKIIVILIIILLVISYYNNENFNMNDMNDMNDVNDMNDINNINNINNMNDMNDINNINNINNIIITSDEIYYYINIENNKYIQPISGEFTDNKIGLIQTERKIRNHPKKYTIIKILIN